MSLEETSVGASSESYSFESRCFSASIIAPESDRYRSGIVQFRVEFQCQSQEGARYRFATMCVAVLVTSPFRLSPPLLWSVVQTKLLFLARFGTARIA